MDGKICVITGGTAGIGLAASLQIGALRPARMILVGRNRQRGEAAVARLRREAPAVPVEIRYADLSSLAEVRRVASEIAGSVDRIDVLVNNAGAIFDRRETTADGLERTFALNHMSYFLLTHLLLDRVRAAGPGARIVNTASEAHRGATLDVDDLQNARRYGGWLAYRRSKLANILFTRELARRLEGSGVVANCLHPGFVASEFGNNNGFLFRNALGLAKRAMAITPEDGAKTITYLAGDPAAAAVSGRYFEKSRELRPSRAAEDDAAARRLWAESERIAGIG
ncbi:MAG TPA: SDR family oxidoreductase [Stellaceae bacterium]|jgi:NAD(P)-dependent dehydrogenase (short-subunit alcohol dehydrogenase family)